MDSLRKRRDLVLQALSTIESALKKFKDEKRKDDHKNMRDSVILSFAFSFDTFWKFLKVYVQERHSAAALLASPRSTLREALNVKILSGQEYTCLTKALEDRNLVAHTYNEKVAEALALVISDYYKVMKEVLERVDL